MRSMQSLFQIASMEVEIAETTKLVADKQQTWDDKKKAHDNNEACALVEPFGTGFTDRHVLLISANSHSSVFAKPVHSSDIQIRS